MAYPTRDDRHTLGSGYGINRRLTNHFLDVLNRRQGCSALNDRLLTSGI